jgi:hypothetical protein
VFECPSVKVPARGLLFDPDPGDNVPVEQNRRSEQTISRRY